MLGALSPPLLKLAVELDCQELARVYCTRQYVKWQGVPAGDNSPFSVPVGHRWSMAQLEDKD